MNTNKFLVGGIIGGVTNFFLGWLIYGMMLMNFMQSHSNNAAGVFRTEETMIWWSLIVGNLASGFLLSYILNKINVSSAMGGATVGAVVGLLMSMAIDFSIYAQVDLWDTTAMAVDILASTVMSTIVGTVIGWYLGRGK